MEFPLQKPSLCRSMRFGQVLKLYSCAMLRNLVAFIGAWTRISIEQVMSGDVGSI